MDRINVKNLEYNYITQGSEGLINSTKYGIFKRFVPTMPKYVKMNKEKKLILLNEKEELKNDYANIVMLVDSYLEDFLTGYIVEMCNGTELNETFLLPEQKLRALKQLRKILTKFENHGIIYDDIHFDNIFYDEKNDKIQLIDIDNISIDKYPKDTISFLTRHYYNHGGKDERKSRIYSFNLISYMLLSNSTSQYNFEYLRKNKQPIFYDKIANKLVEELLYTKIDTTCDNEYLIDMIDEKLLIK